MAAVPRNRKKKKKVDHEALRSSFMRIPRMDVETARDLLDIGFKYSDQLNGRAPEVLFENIQAQRKTPAPESRLWTLRMAVYYVETPDPDPAKMSPWAWQ